MFNACMITCQDKSLDYVTGNTTHSGSLKHGVLFHQRYYTQDSGYHFTAGRLDEYTVYSYQSPNTTTP